MSSGTIEKIVTNLDEKFDVNDIKYIYKNRWEIEKSLENGSAAETTTTPTYDATGFTELSDDALTLCSGGGAIAPTTIGALITTARNSGRLVNTGPTGVRLG